MRKLRLLSGSLPGCLLAFFTISQIAAAQTTAPNEWTWMGGNNTANQPGVYGTLGTPAVGNTPGGRDSAASWTDSSGQLWLFGGGGENEFYGYNDLWKFNPALSEWTWMGGSSTVSCNAAGYCGQPGVYGTLTTPAQGNIPGTRYSAATWTDKNGNLWLFGGSGFDSAGTWGTLNDLWKFNPSTNEWAWMGGISTFPGGSYGEPGVYGTLGSFASGNTPGSRQSAVTWTDSKGNFWLFGGTGFDANGKYGSLNDLWEFNSTTNQFAWISGSSTASESSVYGTLGTAATGNLPGGRSGSARWIDNSGNFWLYGGWEWVDNNESVDDLGDFWEFNPVTNEWTWMGGSQAPYASAVFGALGTPAGSNYPGGRANAASWTDSSGHFWLFGGANGDEAGDLWEFNPSANEWTWMSGSQSPYPAGVYGTLGTPAVANNPGGHSSSTSWTDSSGHFWVFGGFGQDSVHTSGLLNDLWAYQPSPSPSFTAAATPVISPGAGTYTTFQSVSITDTAPGATIYYTTDGTTPTINSIQYSGAITVSTNETVQAIATAMNYLNSEAASATYTFNMPTVATPAITPVSGTYSSAQTVTITDTTAGAAIYYTINGSTPSTGSTLYRGTFQVPVTETINAVAAATNYFNSNVASATYTIPPDFTVPATLPALTIATGNNASDTITVSPLNGFDTSVTFSCSGLPTEATCSFSPAFVTGSGSTKITVTAVAPNTAALRGSGFPLLPGSALAAIVCCFGLRKRRRLQMLVLVVVSVAGLGLVTGCGGGASAPKAPSYTPLPNTETVTVTSSSATQSHTTTFTLTVND
ncbi:MAG: chitobiase/beta-hexosaminidase C-terminal domain-containing protein [Terracidiphilus sp.]